MCRMHIWHISHKLLLSHFNTLDVSASLAQLVSHMATHLKVTGSSPASHLFSKTRITEFNSRIPDPWKSSEFTSKKLFITFAFPFLVHSTRSNLPDPSPLLWFRSCQTIMSNLQSPTSPPLYLLISFLWRRLFSWCHEVAYEVADEVTYDVISLRVWVTI